MKITTLLLSFVLLMGCQSSNSSDNATNFIQQYSKGEGFNLFVLTEDEASQEEIATVNKLIEGVFPFALEPAGFYGISSKEGKALYAGHKDEELPLYILVFEKEIVLITNQIDEIKNTMFNSTSTN